MSASLHGDVAVAIGKQVEQMILEAKQDSEKRVSHDLQLAKVELSRLETIVSELADRVARQNGGGAKPDSSVYVDEAFKNRNIAELEAKWGTEVKALKQDLHRTIMAHNHNSDLMRHHREALARVQEQMEAQPKPAQIDQQIERVEKLVRGGQAKQKALDALATRLGGLEDQVRELMPGLDFPPNLTGAAAAQQQQPQQQQQQQQQQPAASKKKAKEISHEERMQQELLRQQQQAGDYNFNAEAPVFVPRASADSSEAASPAVASPTAARSGGGESPTPAVPGSPPEVPPPPAPVAADSPKAAKEAAAAATSTTTPVAEATPPASPEAPAGAPSSTEPDAHGPPPAVSPPPAPASSAAAAPAEEKEAAPAAAEASAGAPSAESPEPEGHSAPPGTPPPSAPEASTGPAAAAATDEKETEKEGEAAPATESEEAGERVWEEALRH